MAKNDPVSATDARLLALLQSDGRRSYAELATDLGMAAPSVHERVRKLEARGVIRGYSADVDPVSLGLTVLAFTWVTQAPGTVSLDLTTAFGTIPEIEECHHIAGEADYLLKIRAHDMEHLGEVVRQVQAVLGLHGVHDLDAGTSAYCQARPRVPLALLEQGLRDTAAAADRQAPESPLLQGRPLKAADGSTSRSTPTASRTCPAKRRISSTAWRPAESASNSDSTAARSAGSSSSSA